MIRYDLKCENGDEFEAWFGSIADYDKQADAGQLVCPHCGTALPGRWRAVEAVSAPPPRYVAELACKRCKATTYVRLNREESC